MLGRSDVCLVGTSNAENLGGVARLLENFGVPSLWLIAPRVSPEDHRALVVGRAGLERLAGARTVATLDEAVGEASCVVGFSGRRGSRRPAVSLRALPSLLAERTQEGRVALVFGPEDTGLVATDIDRCDLVCAIDTPGPLASFNLVQAVAIALWELARPLTDEPPPSPRRAPTRAQIDALLDHALDALAAIGYLRDGDRERKRVHLLRVLGAAALSSDELKGLHGICAQVLHALASARGGTEPGAR